MRDGWRFTVVPNPSIGLGSHFLVYFFRRDGEKSTAWTPDGLQELGLQDTVGPEHALQGISLPELETLHAHLHAILPNSQEEKVDTEALRAAVASEVTRALTDFFRRVGQK